MRASLAEFTTLSEPILTHPASVYFSYPFNDRSELTVTFPNNISTSSVSVAVVEKTLIGQIISFTDHYAVLRTVFNPGWEFPVYIGPDQVRGLFKGGIRPSISLISKKYIVAEGDIITTADPKILPVGLIIGTVGQTNSDDSSPFFEVSVTLPYSLNEIRQVNLQ